DDFEYLTSTGYDALKRMPNYRVYQEQKNTPRVPNRQDIASFQDGGEQIQQPSPEQIISAFAEVTQQDPQAIMEQLQQMSPEEQQQALQEMMAALQQSQETPEMQDG